MHDFLREFFVSETFLKHFQQIDFEKSQNKKLEKDLKKTLASLEEERANAARHKQVAIMLIKVGLTVSHFDGNLSSVV